MRTIVHKSGKIVHYFGEIVVKVMELRLYGALDSQSEFYEQVFQAGFVEFSGDCVANIPIFVDENTVWKPAAAVSVSVGQFDGFILPDVLVSFTDCSALLVVEQRYIDGVWKSALIELHWRAYVH